MSGEIEKTLRSSRDKLAAIKKSRKLANRRSEFRGSKEAVQATLESTKVLYSALLQIADDNRDEASGYVFRCERHFQGQSRDRLSIIAVGCTLILDLYIPFTNGIQGYTNETDHFDNAHVKVCFSDDVIVKDSRSNDGRKRGIQQEQNYEFDVEFRSDNTTSLGWRSPDSPHLVHSQPLAETIMTEFVDFVERHRTW